MPSVGQFVLPNCCHNKSTHSTTHRRRKFNSLWRDRTTLLLGGQSQSRPNILNGRGILLRGLVGRKLWEATLLYLSTYLSNSGKQKCPYCFLSPPNNLQLPLLRFFCRQTVREKWRFYGWQGLAGYLPFVYPGNFHHNILLLNSVSDQGSSWESPACRL